MKRNETRDQKDLLKLHSKQNYCKQCPTLDSRDKLNKRNPNSKQIHLEKPALHQMLLWTLAVQRMQTVDKATTLWNRTVASSRKNFALSRHKRPSHEVRSRNFHLRDTKK